MNYKDQLQHPQWQKKRLEIMERDNFKCQICGDTETTLNVHHKTYIKGKMAWEYDNDNLITICKNCHGKEHEQTNGWHFEISFEDFKKVKCKDEIIKYLKKYKYCYYAYLNTKFKDISIRFGIKTDGFSDNASFQRFFIIDFFQNVNFFYNELNLELDNDYYIEILNNDAIIKTEINKNALEFPINKYSEYIKIFTMLFC